MNIITADFNWISLLAIVMVYVVGMMRSKMMKSKTEKTMEKPVFFPPEHDSGGKTEEGYTVSEFSDRREGVLEDMDSTCESEVPIESAQPATVYQMFENKPALHDGEEEEEESVCLDLRQAIISSEILRRPDF